jgi:hypothetical protein
LVDRQNNHLIGYGKNKSTGHSQWSVATPALVISLETVMLSIHAASQAPPHVTALFNDGAHSFPLPQGATLAELADRIEALTAMHDGAPISIHIGFDTSATSTQIAKSNAKHVSN